MIAAMDWLRKWAVNIATLGTGAFVFVEREWRSCHVSTQAARDAEPGAYCMVLRLGRIVGRYVDGESLSHPGQVTMAQLARMITQDAQEHAA
jgi:hypothetical protein